MFDRISFLPKVNDSCFLKCDYCMTLSGMEQVKKNQKPTKIMPVERFAEMCDKSLGFNKWFFSILGGEPLLNGKEYFKEVFEIIQSKSQKYYIPYTMRLTTNGLLLDDEWIELLDKYNCKLVISYDGLGNGQKGSKAAHEILKKYASHIQVIQMVINENNHDKLIDVYKELESLNIKYFSTQFDIYADTEMMKQFAYSTVKLFKYIDSLEKPKTSYFVYNDAKALKRCKFNAMNSGDFLNNKIVNDYVIDWDGTIKNGLITRDSQYAVYGNLSDFKHINDVIFTDTMKQVLQDYVTGIRAIGELEEVSFMTRGGGYTGDKFILERQDTPHYPKLACYKILLDAI